MKIVNKEEFYKLPKGTVYSDYKPICITGLKIKEHNICRPGQPPVSFYYQDLIENVDCSGSSEYFDIMQSEQEFKMDYECGDRDDMFDPDQQFIVFDREDVQRLIKVLEETLK